MLKELINILREKKDLSRQQIQQAFGEIMTGKALESDIESILLLLKEKGETIEEITGAALSMRNFVKRIDAGPGVILDTCGTGGDNLRTFNISTIVAFVVAGGGIKVAKHGNRNVSSSCGSADLLEALGINLSIDEKKVEAALKEVGIAFLFAPNLHPAMKYAMPVRKRLKTRTIFNILGPLTNPAFATHQIMGVFDKELVKALAQVLANLGLTHAMVVHGEDGLDEISTAAKTFICEYKNKDFRTFNITPEQFGIKKCNLEELKGADVKTNAKIALEILQGKKGAKRDIVLLNAAAAIYVADAVSSIEEGLDKASQSIDLKQALNKLEQLKNFTNR